MRGTAKKLDQSLNFFALTLPDGFSLCLGGLVVFSLCPLHLCGLGLAGALSRLRPLLRPLRLRSLIFVAALAVVRFRSSNDVTRIEAWARIDSTYIAV